MPLSEAWRQNKPLCGCMVAVWTRSGMVSEDKCLTGKTSESYRETPRFTRASLGERGRVGGRIIQIRESQWSRKQKHKRNACTPPSVSCLLPRRVLTSHKELPVSLSLWFISFPSTPSVSLCSLCASCTPGLCLLPERSRKEPAEQNGAPLPALRPCRRSLHTLRCDAASQMLCRASYVTHTLTHKCTPHRSNKVQFTAYDLQLEITSRQSTFLSFVTYMPAHKHVVKILSCAFFYSWNIHHTVLSLKSCCICWGEEIKPIGLFNHIRTDWKQ